MLVSVWITTYNHAPYIAQAIEGALMQQTSFDFELVIGEDCSTDDTRRIVKDYKAKYPDKIRLLLPEKNLGMVAMFQASYSLCTGQYIAWLDGDDYWTDPLKLQKQVDFLEANPEYVLCFHKVKTLDQVSNVLSGASDPLGGLKDTLVVDDFIKIRQHNPIYALSVVHRHVLGQQLPEWFISLPVLDLGIYFLLLQFGKMKYIDEDLGTYREHSGGAWSGKTAYQHCNQMVQFYQRLLPNLHYLNHNKLYKDKVVTKICLLSFDLLEMNMAAGHYDKAGNNLLVILTYKQAILKYRKRRAFNLLKKYIINMSYIKWVTKQVSHIRI